MARHGCELDDGQLVKRLIDKLDPAIQGPSSVTLHGRQLDLQVQRGLDFRIVNNAAFMVELRLPGLPAQCQAAASIGTIGVEGQFRCVLANGIHIAEVRSSDPQQFLDSLPFEVRFNAMVNIVLTALDDFYSGDEIVTLLSEDGEFKIQTPYAESGPYRFDSVDFINDGKLSKQAIAKLTFDGILTWRHHAQTHV